jgi:glycosyltransferase involved in cell wall biosynthesis
MKVTIVTVSYNAESTIRNTIESVLSQNGVALEYIIIDGDSTDGTKKIIESFGSQITHFISEKDRGIYDGMNKGVSMASGDVIGILNADDIYCDNQVLRNVLDSFSTEIEAVYGNLQYVDQFNTEKIVRTWISKKYNQGDFLKGWMPPHPTFFLRRTVYEELGLYTLKLKSAADYELMLRLIHKHGIKLNYLDKIIVKMRTGGKSNASLKNRLNANKEDRMAWKMNDLKAAPFTFIRKPLSKLSQFLKR